MNSQQKPKYFQKDENTVNIIKAKLKSLRALSTHFGTSSNKYHSSLELDAGSHKRFGHTHQHKHQAQRHHKP
ncbi:hypothetical protein Hanom_Chr12g01109761 [Helianthus anomalus]